MIELKGGTQMDIPLNDEGGIFQQALGSHPIGRFLSECGQQCGCPVTVRYECGECCLKATNARLAGIVDDFLGLRAFGPQGIITEPCECEEHNGPPPTRHGECSQPGCNASQPPTNGAQCALIPLDRVCSIESGSPQTGLGRPPAIGGMAETTD